MTTIGTIGSVVINVADYEKEKAFWQSFLGVGVAREFPGFCWLEPQRPGGISVALQKSPDPGDPAGRVHLDSLVADLAEARTAIEALGGSHVEDHEIMGFRWEIMADPEGNRFCIAERGAD
jgi:catechol 2,3-dioxygenase-like lactoylglutathione lyase family enzyme